MSTTTNKAIIVAGMAYGDEGKGATVDFLARDLGAGLVVRYNGGPQAAHNVCLEDGRHHTFSQFGSGSFVPDVRTHLSRFMLINPIGMMEEEEHLRSIGVDDLWDRTTVDQQCVIVTPYHRAFNRLQEISRGHRAHGSCGMGVGDARRLELAGLSLRAHDLFDSHPYKIHIKNKLMEIRHYLLKELIEFRYALEDTPEVDLELSWFYGGDRVVSDRLDILQQYYSEWINKVLLVPSMPLHHNMIFEGAQGVLLDEKYGVQPYTTWTNTTFENAMTLLDEAQFTGERIRLGCWRSYFTRHGAGPFDTEIQWPEYSQLEYPENHNTLGRYQGKWRVGRFNYNQAGRAVKICGGIDQAAVSHMDIHEMNLSYLEDYIDAPVTIVSYGATAKDRKTRMTGMTGPGRSL
jgi:adenylosuccinate synthase